MNTIHFSTWSTAAFRRCGAFLAFGFLLGCPAVLSAQSLSFGQTNYTAQRGDTVVLLTAFSAPVPNGLQGYSLRLSFPAGTVSLTPSDISVPPALNYDLFGPPADREVTATTAVVSGFVDFGAPPYNGTAFAVFSVTIPLNAPLGTHTLRLDPHLPGGYSFVNGEDQGIDGMLIFGTAQLQITDDGEPPTGAYATWATGFGLDPATNGAPLADANGDGVENAVRFALGQSPLEYRSPAEVRQNGNFLEIAYTRSLSAAAEATLVAEFSTTLGSWTTSGVENILISTVGDIEQRVGRVSLPPGGRGFLRLRIALE